jgi:hypothetical protein
MLYGNQAAEVADDPSPHFQLATTGVVFTVGSDVLYTMEGCMSESPSDCLPPDHPYYRVGPVRSGALISGCTVSINFHSEHELSQGA